MSKTAIRYVGAATLTALVALLPAAAHAQSDQNSQHSQVGAAFNLSIENEFGTLLDTASLTCHPAAGSHPSPQEACAQLENAGWQAQNIPPLDQPCTREYNPVTVRLEGTHQQADGFVQQVSYVETFANRCGAIIGTGGVLFDF